MSESPQAAPALESSLDSVTPIKGGTVPVSPSVGAASGRRAPRGRASWRERFEITLLSGPAIVVFVTFVIVPVFAAVYYGFYRWKGYGPPTDFIGLHNYKVILTDPEFHREGFARKRQGHPTARNSTLLLWRTPCDSLPLSVTAPRCFAPTRPCPTIKSGA